MSIFDEVKDFGTTKEGKTAKLYTVTGKGGMKAVFTDFGAILVSLYVPDRDGKLGDVVLGYDSLEKYFVNGPNFGSTIGRHANRIGKASFTLNGQKYELDKNDGNNNLHGGFNGYHKRLWEASEREDNDGKVIIFKYFSKDLDQGFPGNISVSVEYKVRDDNALSITYYAKSDKDTVVNLTNHTYFNLAGHDNGSILGHKVWLDSDEFTYADEESIPNGEIRKVKGTPMDFTTEKVVGDDIDADYDQIKFGKGFDHNWILKTKRGIVSLFGTLKEETTGRLMEMYTDLPGVQFYSGNFLNGTDEGKGGFKYQRRSGLCFETQFYPNAINVPSFPQPVIKANDEFTTTTVYKFKTV